MSRRVAVSVIVPAFNAMDTLRGCLDSLTALPTVPSHEIIVVDNGSTDGTLAFARTYPGVTALSYTETQGPSGARNAGAQAARGEILAFTDADCVVSQDWLRAGLAAFSPWVSGVAGAIEGVEPRNEVQAWMNARRILDQRPTLSHPYRPFIQTANAFYRRRDFIEAGGFDETMPVGEDCDLSWRILEVSRGGFAYSEEALVLHDHRATPKALFRQSAKNAGAGAYLFQKWRGELSAKSWKTSVWECMDLARSAARYAGTLVGLVDQAAAEARLDMLHRAGRKWGMVRSAVALGEWRQW